MVFAVAKHGQPASPSYTGKLHLPENDQSAHENESAPFFDKNFPFRGGSIRRAVLCVNGILTTQIPASVSAISTSVVSEFVARLR